MTLYSRARFDLLRAVAQREPGIDVTAPPLIDTLFREQLLEQRGGIVGLTAEGGRQYRAMCQAEAAAKLPGVVSVQAARQSWRCAAADEHLGWHVTAPAVAASVVTGAGAAGYLDQLRAVNGDLVAADPIVNPAYDPDCVGVIAAGEPYALHRPDPRHPARRLHVRCALAVITEQETSRAHQADQ